MKASDPVCVLPLWLLFVRIAGFLAVFSERVLL